MAAAVIQLRKPRSQRQHREPTREEKLAVLRFQSRRAMEARNPALCGETLRMLAYLAKVARPRAKSIYWDGIRFPLRQGLVINSVLCPDTGRPLVGAMAL